MTSIFNIKFIVNCFTSPGQQVYICGNTIQLGNWKPQNSFKLFTDKTLYPKWNSYRNIQIRQGNKIMFKICIIKDKQIIRWQNIVQNRQIIAKQHILIQCQANQLKMNISPLPDQIIQVIKPPRKKTIQILNQLQSDDGSSSNEYWKDYMKPVEQSILYLTLTTQMRRIIEYQNNNQINQLNQCLSEISNYNYSYEFDQELIEKMQKQNQMRIKSSNLYFIVENQNYNEFLNLNGIHLVSVSEFINSYTLINNQSPLLFHIQSLKENNQNAICIRILQSIQRIVHAQNMLLNNQNKKIQCYISLKINWICTKDFIKQLLNRKISLLLFQKQQILDQFLNIINQIGLQFYIQNSTQIIVKLKYQQIIVLKLINQKHRQNNNLTYNTKQQITYPNVIINTIINKNKQFYYLGSNSNNFIQAIKQDDTFFNIKHHRRNIIILNVNKIQDLSDKILTQISQLSSKPNIQIFIILNKLTQNLRAKFPVSKNNKIVFLSKNGLIYSNQDKILDLFQKLSINKQNFIENIKILNEKIIIGLNKKYTLSNLQTVYEFKNNSLGQKSIQFMKKKIKQINNKSIYKLFYQEQYDNNYIITIRPFCLTEEFYIKTILQTLSKNIQDDKGLIISVNLNNNSLSSKFIQKVNAIFYKNIKNKYNVKLRNFQVILSNNDITLPKLVKEQVITNEILQKFLQFLCEHFLAGSQIKSYPIQSNFNNKKNRKSYLQRRKYQSFQSDIRDVR